MHTNPLYRGSEHRWCALYPEDIEVGGHRSKAEPVEDHIWLPWQPHTPAAAHDSHLKTAPQHTLEKSSKICFNSLYYLHHTMYIRGCTYTRGSPYCWMLQSTSLTFLQVFEMVSEPHLPLRCLPIHKIVTVHLSAKTTKLFIRLRYPAFIWIQLSSLGSWIGRTHALKYIRVENALW